MLNPNSIRYSRRQLFAQVYEWLGSAVFPCRATDSCGADFIGDQGFVAGRLKENLARDFDEIPQFHLPQMEIGRPAGQQNARAQWLFES
jgi:hypothetical protein